MRDHGDTAPAPDRFELRGEIGTGGMGVVYRVFDRVRGEEVAMKTLKASSGRDVYRFKREFRALADLSHPNLVALHELFHVADEFMFTMELVDGVPFQKWATDEKKLRSALVQLVDGLCALHAAGKVHRDLKPSNVLVEATGRAVILDFGLVTDLESFVVDRTHENAAVGTPAYMSPEQSADKPVGPATDWYAVGAMLYEAIAGKRPFEGTAPQVLAAKQKTDPKPIEIAPRDLAALAMRLLAREPEERPDGAEVLALLGAEPSPWTLRIAEKHEAVRPLGREAQLEEIHRAFADSRKGLVTCVLYGPSGSGKTTLLQAFASEVRDGDAVVLAGKASARESLPYRALDGVIDALAAYLVSRPIEEVTALVPPGIQALARLFPAMRRVPAAQLPMLPGALPDEAELRQRAFAALRDLIVAIGAEQPLVIAMDDMQWSTPQGARVLGELLHDPRKPRCLLVLGHRSENDASPVLKELGGWWGDLRTIRLDPVRAV